MARILVADDSADMRHLLSALLIDQGHSVQVAPDGSVALGMILKQAPDLLILDVIMPTLDGYSLLRELRERNLREEIKILVLSAKTSEGDIVKGYKLGADRYLTKPFAADEMLRMVQHMLDTPKADLKGKTEEELDKAQLLSRLESMFTDL
jgi:DNA-binding response OmpR family regulator